jgi:hypothetical protein
MVLSELITSAIRTGDLPLVEEALHLCIITEEKDGLHYALKLVDAEYPVSWTREVRQIVCLALMHWHTDGLLALYETAMNTKSTEVLSVILATFAYAHSNKLNSLLTLSVKNTSILTDDLDFFAEQYYDHIFIDLSQKYIFQIIDNISINEYIPSSFLRLLTQLNEEEILTKSHSAFDVIFRAVISRWLRQVL